MTLYVILFPAVCKPAEHYSGWQACLNLNEETGNAEEEE